MMDYSHTNSKISQIDSPLCAQIKLQKKIWKIKKKKISEFCEIGEEEEREGLVMVIVIP